jgi:hypothetical protein
MGPSHAWLALGALCLALPGLKASEPPIRDSIRISAAVLLKGESAPAPSYSGEWVKVPSKKLPSSIAIYLKPTTMVDCRSDAVRKASGQVLRLMGQAGAKLALEDPRLLAEAVKDYAALNLAQPGIEDESRPYATDTRTLLPKASQLLRQGFADHAGEVRVRLALLRALGVPARAAWLRGASAVEYWAQWLKDDALQPQAKRPKRGPAEPAQPRGEWVMDETCFPGESAEAWSLDAAELAPALWLPEQELAYEGSLEKAYFALSETALATQALGQIQQNGALPLSLTARALPPRKGPWLMLANHRAHFYTEGSMEALNPLELLLPYRPKLASWGSQQRPIPESLETLATAFWTDRPDRARIKKNGEWTDEYKSPPPAYGILHYASISLRKPASILDAHLEEGALVGKLLRRDSLAPRANWDILISFPGQDAASPLSQGGFKVALDAADLRSPWIKVSGGQGAMDLSRWDSLLVHGMP